MKRALVLSAAAITVAALFAAGLGVGAVGTTGTKLTARLAAKSETPAPRGAAHAAGVFTATLTGRSLTWRLTFTGLTGRAAAAHIHLGKTGAAGPVAVPLCGPCVAGAHGKVTITAKIRTALLSGGAYVNVHTARNAAGEIRGQVAGGRAAPVTTTAATTTDDGGYGY